jgi:hypothetical protein
MDPDSTPTSIELAQQAARFAPFWENLNPAAGGTCHFDVDPTNTEAYFTWDNVPAYTVGPTGPGNSFQLVLRADGSAEFRYRQMPNQSLLTVVGWSRGLQAIPPITDISAAMPFQASARVRSSTSRTSRIRHSASGSCCSAGLRSCRV